jgi:hypothetical protein
MLCRAVVPALPDGKVRPATEGAMFDEYFGDFIGPQRRPASVRQQMFVPPGRTYAAGAATGPRASDGGGWECCCNTKFPTLCQNATRTVRSSRSSRRIVRPRAGLREGDLIVRFAGHDVQDPHGLRDLVRGAEPNQVDIVRIREGMMLSKSAVVGRLRDQRAVPNAEVGGQGQYGAGGTSRR